MLLGVPLICFEALCGFAYAVLSWIIRDLMSSALRMPGQLQNSPLLMLLAQTRSCVPTVGSRTPKVPQLFYSVKHTMLIGGGSGVPRVRISKSRVDTVWKELVKQAIICGGRGYGQGADVCRYYKGRETPPKSRFHRKTLKGNFSSLRNTLVELSILGSSSEREQVLVLSMTSLLKNPYFFPFILHS